MDLVLYQSRRLLNKDQAINKAINDAITEALDQIGSVVGFTQYKGKFVTNTSDTHTYTVSSEYYFKGTDFKSSMVLLEDGYYIDGASGNRYEFDNKITVKQVQKGTFDKIEVSSVTIQNSSGQNITDLKNYNKIYSFSYTTWKEWDKETKVWENFTVTVATELFS